MCLMTAFLVMFLASDNFPLPPQPTLFQIACFREKVRLAFSYLSIFSHENTSTYRSKINDLMKISTIIIKVQLNL